MHEVAKASSGALPEATQRVTAQREEGENECLPHFILTTARFPEVRDRTEFRVDGLPIEPAIVETLHRLLCIILIAELSREGRGEVQGPYRVYKLAISAYTPCL